jgi:hypothetical protein
MEIQAGAQSSGCFEAFDHSATKIWDENDPQSQDLREIGVLAGTKTDLYQEPL